MLKRNTERFRQIVVSVMSDADHTIRMSGSIFGKRSSTIASVIEIRDINEHEPLAGCEAPKLVNLGKSDIKLRTLGTVLFVARFFAQRVSRSFLLLAHAHDLRLPRD